MNTQDTPELSSAVSWTQELSFVDDFVDQGESLKKKVAKTTVAVKGVELLSQQTATAKHHIHLHLSYSILDGIALSPALQHHNNAKIEDRWVPNVLWLWAANRIRSGTDFKQLNPVIIRRSMTGSHSLQDL